MIRPSLPMHLPSKESHKSFLAILTWKRLDKKGRKGTERARKRRNPFRFKFNHRFSTPERAVPQLDHQGHAVKLRRLLWTPIMLYKIVVYVCVCLRASQ